MTSFSWWSDQVSEGYSLCALCFEAKPVFEAWTDNKGLAWDVCRACQKLESERLGGRRPRWSERIDPHE